MDKKYLALGAYIIVMVLISIYGYLKTKSSASAYTIASKKLGLGFLVPMFFGGFISSVALIGFTGFAYTNGFAFFSTYALGCALGWLLLQIVSGKFYSMDKEWVTTPEVLGDRFYSEKMRLWMTFVNVVYMILYITMGLMGGGVLLSGFLGFSYYTGVILIAVILLIYTAFGGMFSVASANTVQAVILFVGVIFAAVGGLNLVGGWGNMVSSMAEIDGALVTATARLPLTAISGLTFGVATAVVSSTWYHRMVFTSKDRKTATSFFGIGAIPLTIAYVCFFIIGASVRVLAPDLPNQELAFTTMLDLLPPSFSVIVVVMALAALQSTLDNNMLAAGSMISNDIYGHFKPNSDDKTKLLVSRLGTFGTGILAFVVAMARPGMVIAMYNLVVAVVASSIFVPMFLGFFWKRATKEGALTGSVIGFIVSAAWFFFGPKSINASLIGIPVSIILTYAISLTTSPPPKEVETQFFGA